MEMRVTEDVGLGVDLTPPIPPLAFVLRDSALASHCSACFSALQTQQQFSTSVAHSTNSHLQVPTTQYCSDHCSSLDSALHFSSGENQLLRLFNRSSQLTWNDSSDLRLSLRLLSILQQIPGKSRGSQRLQQQLGQNDDVLDRIGGLMTNRENLCDSGEIEGNIGDMISEGAKLMAMARRIQQVGEYEHEEAVLEETLLCLVLTNAVEVHEMNGCAIGVAVYSATFSWINHSCSPNSCYRFVLEPESNDYALSSLRIASANKNDTSSKHDSGLQFSDMNMYGPRLIVRSIKSINKGDEVTVAYADLLQPKDMRQEELWLKYRFLCSCSRCVEVPETYVDHALRALSATNSDSPEAAHQLETLIPAFDDVITEYLSSGDPISCCNSLENLLIHGCLSDPTGELKEARSLKLQPFHYLSLNAYTTLASAYRVRANETTSCKLDAFNMYKTSAAYSLLLAGAVHHLFTFESSLVANTGNFFVNAGESLLHVVRNLEFPSISPYRCDQCRIGSTRDPNSSHFEVTMSEVYRCIRNTTPKIWSILSCGNRFLEAIENPLDFSWLAFSETVTPVMNGLSAEPCMEKESSELEAEYGDVVRMKIFILGVHCLKYGSVLLRICYGLSADRRYYRTGDG